jgi:hypothetical protein
MQPYQITLISVGISALVSVSVVAISRWVFSRNDRRFPVLVLIQEELLKLQRDPPWDGNGGGLHLHKIRSYVAHINPYFARLRMVSFPKRNCPAQEAWKKLSNFEEDVWRRETQREQDLVDFMTKKEFMHEIDDVLNKLF